MNVILERENFVIHIARDRIRNARLGIFIGRGRKLDAAPGELIWRQHWEWSSRSLPCLIWRGWRPIGYRALRGRCRIF